MIGQKKKKEFAMNQIQQVIVFMSIKKAHLNFLKYQIGELDETDSLARLSGKYVSMPVEKPMD